MRGDRQGENAVGGSWGDEGKREGREDNYAYRCPSFSLTDLNNTGDCGEGNSDVVTTTLLFLLPAQGNKLRIHFTVDYQSLVVSPAPPAQRGSFAQ